jgi:hypothetical protein
MKKHLLTIAAFIVCTLSANAVDNNTVEIIYNGTTATVTVASNISSYVTVESGTSSHVKIIQDASFAGVNKTADNEDGEIIYTLSGSSTDGEFYMEGAYKCVVELNGVTLTNPSGPAINVQDGKRIEVNAKKNTTNTITDGTNEDYNGCLHCKGHLKLKGKGTLNVVGNSKHGIYSKEYMEVKNLTLNVTAAQKDAIHCKEYFLMEGGTVTLSNAGDDGIHVELSNNDITGITTDHEDENSGNFYMTAGTLTISNYAGKAIKTDGTISYSGGTQNFDTTDTETSTDISHTKHIANAAGSFFDLSGREVASPTRGLFIIRKNGKTFKSVIR